MEQTRLTLSANTVIDYVKFALKRWATEAEIRTVSLPNFSPDTASKKHDGSVSAHRDKIALLYCKRKKTNEISAIGRTNS